MESKDYERIFIKSSFLKLHQKVNFGKKPYGFREWGDVEKPGVEESGRGF